MDQWDFLIVGQGLAGTTLAWALKWRGARVLVVDQEKPVTSSKIAAGLITPITGQRLQTSWRINELLPVAEAFYRRLESLTGRKFFHPTKMVRLLANELEQSRWERRQKDGPLSPYLSNPQPSLLVDPMSFHQGFGGFEMSGSARLDVTGYLQASREYFIQEGGYRAAVVRPGHIIPAKTHAQSPELGVQARVIIFCQGFTAQANPFFNWIPFKAAKGEILTLESNLKEERIVHSGGWLMPGNTPGTWRAGSTYDWNTLDEEPTLAGLAIIETRLKSLLNVPWKVINHQAAVRPIIRESKALMGLHPVHNALGFFNGLGSKGSLHAPFCASQFADSLTGTSEIEEALDLRKSFR